jgi:tRNA(Arg) A34 adenosine deaminase TadA
VLSVGKNNYLKTHPYQAKLAAKMGEHYRIFLHAEISALIRLKEPEKAYRILVTRFGKKGAPLNAKPCRICAEALSIAGIKLIEHT